jgi:hypothetical protein
MSEWAVREPTVLEVDGPIREVDVRIVCGHVDLVKADGPGAQVEVTAIDGPPLRVTVAHGRLTIEHEDLHWASLLSWRHRGRERRHATVSVAVPAECRASVGVVSADAVVAGIDGDIRIRCVDGDVVLDRAGGSVQVQSVSGDVELRGITGSIAWTTVSGGLTVVDGRPPAVKAKSVSGDVTLDLQAPGAVVVDVTTVSGDLTVRVPASAGLEVDVVSASGDVASAFDGVEMSRLPGAHRMSGRVGDGAGRLRGRSVSGRVALLAAPQR